MATSGSNDFLLNARQIVDYAYKKANIIGLGQAIDGDNMARGIRELNLMLKGWQTAGPNVWRRSTAAQTPVASTASYTLSTTKPYKIVSARYRQNGRDLPMEELTADEYDDIPLKTSSGIPTTFYFDRQRDNGTLYIWPVPTSVTTETIQYTYQRRFEDVDNENNNLDIPQEYLHLIGYNLAASLLDDVGASDAVANRIIQRAGLLLMQAKDADREAIVRFEPDWR